LAALRLTERAFRERWFLGNEERREVVEQLLSDALTAESPRVRVAAARVLVAADAVNAARDRTAVSERQGDARLRLDALLAHPQVRQALAEAARQQIRAGTAPQAPGPGTDDPPPADAVNGQ
jgi:hypothetical protein